MVGLERFADAFEREEVSLDNLPELSDEDLKALGVTFSLVPSRQSRRRVVCGNTREWFQLRVKSLPATHRAAPWLPSGLWRQSLL